MSRDVLLTRIEAKFELLRRKAKNGDFWSFCLYDDYEFFTKRKFLKKISDAFQEVYFAYKEGRTITVSCSLPPRAGKSYITSLFSAFMLGHFPKESVMRNTCTGHLYDKFSIDTRDIIRSQRFAEVFGNVVMHPSRQNIDGWSLKSAKQVSYFGAGVGGAIIGFGASMLAITDDLFKGFEEAMSEKQNEKTWRWKEGAHDSRTEGNCCKIDIGTRWCEDDVIGRMEEKGNYDIIVRIPALIKDESTGEIRSFCEDVHTTEYYLDLESEIDEMIWSAEYMQEPIEAKGLLFPKKDLHWFTMDEIKDKSPDGVIGACDVADSGVDFFSAPFGKLFHENVMITDVVFTQDAVEITEVALTNTIINTNCDIIRIESNNGGRIFSTNIKKLLKEEKSSCEVKARFTSQNKETRILMKSGFVKKHFWFRSDYKKGSDYERFIKQLVKYKRVVEDQKDDAPDSLTILAEFIDHLGIFKKKTQSKKPLTKSALGIR